MLKNDYRYALALYREDRTLVGQVAVEVDWEPAREWAEFEAIRRSRGDSSAGTASRFSIEPSWHAELNEPFTSGFRVRVEGAGEEMSPHIPSSYFNALATRASRHFMEQGALKQGDSFFYFALAFPAHSEADEETKPGFTAEDVTPPLAIGEGLLEDFERGALQQGQHEADDFPVFVPERILSEAAALSRLAEAKETGGILIGHLRRDSSNGRELFAEVTAQIPAQHTVAELARLTFTSETWTDVRAALELRQREELMLGWWHSHPAREWCRECSPEKQKVCAMAKDFFSEHDHALHRTIFPKAYSIALVVNDVAFEEPGFSLFGWRRGLLVPRSFFVTNRRSETAAAALS
jgi:hypothetical protein